MSVPRVPALLCAALAITAASPAVASEGDSSPVVGGELDTGDPAVGFITIELEDGSRWICSGTLISPTVVLTAAHCVDDLPGEVALIDVYFGTNARGDDDGFIDHVPALDWAFWPDWILNVRGDIGLIRLMHSPNVEPVPINRVPLEDGDVGSDLRVAGWGLTGGRANDSGIKRTATTTLSALATPWVLHYGTESTNICSGDSGGPTFVERDGTEVVAGINSFGYAPNCRGVSGASRVAPFADWIDAWLERWSSEPRSVSEGDACRTHLDCETGFCPVEEGAGVCRMECSVSANDCSGDLACAPVTGDVGSCVIAEESGGCNASGAPASLALALLVLLCGGRLPRRPRYPGDR